MIDIGSLIPSIVGLGAKVAGAVPGMKKPPKSRTAKAVAQQATGQFGAAVGAAQAGHGASRGLALREGLRQGVAAVDAASGQVAKAAANDELINEKRRQQRNENIASFSTDLAKGLGDMAALGVQGKKGESDLQDPDRPEVDVNPETGFGAPQDESMVGSDNLDDIEQGLNDQEQVEQQEFMDDAGQRLDDFKLQREEAGISAAPEQKSEQESTAAMIEEAYGSQPEMAPAVEKELAQTLHMKQLMLAEMERTGANFGEMIPRVNRRLGLSPGQSLQNPHAISSDLDVTGES